MLKKTPSPEKILTPDGQPWPRNEHGYLLPWRAPSGDVYLPAEPGDLRSIPPECADLAKSYIADHNAMVDKFTGYLNRAFAVIDARTAEISEMQPEIRKLRADVDKIQRERVDGGKNSGKKRTDTVTVNDTEALRLAKLLPKQGKGLSLDKLADDVVGVWVEGELPTSRSLIPGLSEARKKGLLPPRK